MTEHKTVRAKFRITKVSKSEGWGTVTGDDGKSYYQPCVVNTIESCPVCSNGNPEHENTKFWQASPSGNFTLTCISESVLAHLAVGDEFYIDITKA